MIDNINEIPKNISGIYIINYDNGKIYIGQALNIKTRANEHNNKTPKYPCDLALRKHNAKISILEKISDILLLEERETYWIAKYDATNKDVGYNILKSGNASGKRGVEHVLAAFNQEQLDEIVDLLINHLELSLIDIANLYGVNQNTILRISRGQSYINPNLKYPLRNNNHEFAKKDFLDYFKSEEELIQCKEDLLFNWELSLEKDIKEKYNLPLRIVHEINNGQKFSNIGQFEYPIRKKNKRNNLNFTKQDILDILYDLRYSDKSMTQIGIEHNNAHRNTISNINNGKNYIIKEYDYPARKTN